jgi:hypothetical protein
LKYYYYYYSFFYSTTTPSTIAYIVAAKLAVGMLDPLYYFGIATTTVSHTRPDLDQKGWFLYVSIIPKYRMSNRDREWVHSTTTIPLIYYLKSEKQFWTTTMTRSLGMMMVSLKKAGSKIPKILEIPAY